MPRPLGLLSVDTGPPNKGCGAVALTLHKVSRLSGVNKTDKAKVAPARPPYAPSYCVRAGVLDQLRRSEMTWAPKGIPA